jgi:hypothetical protein
MPAPPAILRTHPVDAERIDAIATQARNNGWALDGELTSMSLPARAVTDPAR